MPYIEYFELNKIEIRLCEGFNAQPTDNIFSVIVGKNGAGKSRFLTAIADHIVKEPNFFGEGFKKVIAVSTSPFDKFKITYKSKERASNECPYHYIGMKNSSLSRAPAISLIASIATGLIDNFLLSHRNSQLAKVFDILGFQSEVTLVMKLNNQRPERQVELEDYRVEALVQANILSSTEQEDTHSYGVKWLLGRGFVLSEKLISKIIGITETELNRLDYALDQVTYFLAKQKLGAITLDYAHSLAYSPSSSSFASNFNDAFESERRISSLFEDLQYSNETLEHLSLLLRYELVQINDVRLRKAGEQNMSLRRASSGEQCMMVIMLGIAGNIEDESCILIDEPEISFHPEWQERFIELLTHAFSNYSGCHFIIATHSPQITAKLNSKNCYVTSLNTKNMFRSDFFSNKSADFQLAEIFDAPGTNNEYIMRLTFNLLAILRSKQKISAAESQLLKKLVDLRSTLDASDPVGNLIDSAKEIYAHYASDK